MNQVSENYYIPKSIPIMKGIITTIFLATVVCGIQCVSAHCWDVEWYEIDPVDT